MTLKAVVGNLDEVDEAFRSEYKEGEDGKFYLDVDDTIRTHTSVLALANSLKAVKAEKAKLATDIAALNKRIQGLPDDFDPAKVAEMTTELERLRAELQAKGGTPEQLQQLREQYEGRIRTMTAASEAALAAERGEVTARDGELASILVDSGLTQALVDVGVKKEMVRATVALLKPSIRVVIDDATKRRKAVVETDLGEIDLVAYVQTWAKSEEGKPFLVPATGGGAGGSDRGVGGANPWRAAEWNVTAQGAVARADPAKADRMAKAAGTYLGGPMPAAKKSAA